MRHKNIPVFIPHLGCPNACVFCNQRSISGRMRFDESDVRRQIEEATATLREGDEAEIAFFGGSFTGIDRELMVRLLCLADEFVAAGKVGAVRLSTRPDYIDAEILRILGEHHVKTVELGLQCLDDGVLTASRRGHDAAAAARACAMIKDAGFALIGQMMVGLPGADGTKELETAQKICDWGADGARVYPTVVFYGTELCEMAQRGEYAPLSQDEAVRRTADVLDVFDRRGVPVIRVGLCASENLASVDEVYAGPNHPALGELAMGEVFFRRVCAEMDRRIATGDADGARETVIFVPRGATSRAVGQKRSNIVRLAEKYSLPGATNHFKILEKSELIGYNIEISFI